MRATGKVKAVTLVLAVRFGAEGVSGLWRDKTRPWRVPPLSPVVADAFWRWQGRRRPPAARRARRGEGR